jgi:hypothetical protein
LKISAFLVWISDFSSSDNGKISTLSQTDVRIKYIYLLL